MKQILAIFLLTLSLTVAGQDQIEITEKDYGNMEVEMADDFRKEGKIYVLVSIIGVIMAGLLVYVVVIDRRITKLEKEVGEFTGDKE